MPEETQTPEGQTSTAAGTTAETQTQTQTPAQTQAQLPAELQQFAPLIDTINQNVAGQLSAAETANNERVAQLNGRLDQLTQERQSGGGMFNRAPAGVSGPLVGKEEDRRGYNMWRVAGMLQGNPHIGRDQCKVELAQHEKLRKYYVEQNGLSLGGINSILMPLGSALIADLDPGYGQEVQQMLAQGISGADPAEMQAAVRQGYSQFGEGRVRQALSMFDDTALGIFLGGVEGEMISLLRNREVFSRAGATQITLPPNGYLSMGRQTGAATGHWVGENEEITTSEPSTGSLEMRARKAAAMVTIPNELLRFGTPSVEAFIRADMARVLSLMADLAFLEGAGNTTQPRGILNYGNIVGHSASTLATDGNQFEPNDAATMVSELEERNHDVDMDAPSWVMRPKMWKRIRTRRTGVYDGSSTAELGQYLFDVNRADIEKGSVSRMDGYPVIKSSQVSNTRTKGSGTDLSYVLLGIFRHWVIGRVGVMEFATSTQGDEVFKKDQSKLRAIQHVDGVPRYEDAFVLCDTLDMDLPAD